MLILVEPFLKHLIDRPNLGCAMLISACKEKGIKTTLVRSQTRYLKNMFVDDSEELWNLIQDLKNDDLRMLGIADYKRSLREKGMRQFRDELKELYRYVIVEKSLRHYLNFHKVEKIAQLYSLFMRIYSHYLVNLKSENLNIVNGYVAEILNNNPRYIGFSTHSFFSIPRIIRKLIKKSTGAPIILGGPLTPFLTPREIKEIFKREYFDYLIVGAGERALPALIESLENKKEPRGVANVFYKKGAKLESNTLKAIDDLDKLPYPDYSQFDLDSYLSPKRILPLQAARGCSWGKCTFCDYQRNNFGIYKEFSIQRIIDTILHLNRTYDCRDFWLHNDDFPAQRAQRLSEAILQKKLGKLSFYMYARLEEGFNNSRLLSVMRKSGVIQIHWGLESGCQRILNKMGKGTELAIMSQILKKSSKNRISNVCLAFFGFPGETRKEAQETVKFLRKHSGYIDDVQLKTFAFSPFSNIANIGRRVRKIDDDGAYLIKHDKASKEIGIFYKETLDKIKVGNIAVTKNNLRFIKPSGYYYCGLYALISTLGLMPKKDILISLRENRLSSIFPIILGEIKKEKGAIMLYPVNSRETPFINELKPERGGQLDRIEEEIFALSDGKMSIEDIGLNIYNRFKGEYTREFVRKKCAGFFRNLFSKNWGLGFRNALRLPLSNYRKQPHF